MLLCCVIDIIYIYHYWIDETSNAHAFHWYKYIYTYIHVVYMCSNVEYTYHYMNTKRHMSAVYHYHIRAFVSFQSLVFLNICHHFHLSHCCCCCLVTILGEWSYFKLSAGRLYHIHRWSSWTLQPSQHSFRCVSRSKRSHDAKREGGGDGWIALLREKNSIATAKWAEWPTGPYVKKSYYSNVRQSENEWRRQPAACKHKFQYICVCLCAKWMCHRVQSKRMSIDAVSHTKIQRVE